MARKNEVALKSLGELEVGDIVRHAGGGQACVVTANYGSRVTAVRTVDVTNPNEWLKITNDNDAVDVAKLYADGKMPNDLRASNGFPPLDPKKNPFADLRFEDAQAVIADAKKVADDNEAVPVARLYPEGNEIDGAEASSDVPAVKTAAAGGGGDSEMPRGYATVRQLFLNGPTPNTPSGDILSQADRLTAFVEHNIADSNRQHGTPAVHCRDQRMNPASSQHLPRRRISRCPQAFAGTPSAAPAAGRGRLRRAE